MIDLRELIETCKAEAIASRFYPTESDHWHWFCREYSKLFHTPLFHVMTELSPEHVILSVFEEQLENRSLQKREDVEYLVEQIRRLEDPNYDANQEKEIQDLIASAEAFEEVRVKEGRPIPGIGKQIPQTLEPEKELPKQGYVNLAYLEKEDSEG